MNITPDQFKDSIPFNVRLEDSKPVIDWLYAGECRFTDPFFEDTVKRCLSLQENNKGKLTTTFEVISELRRQFTSCPPSGFIFHTSRCGSTLTSQMLAALQQNIVISEAPPVDSILRARLKENIPVEQRTKWLVDLIWILGRKRFDEKKSLFVKFDSWHILDFNFISSAFPGVPCIFLYRDPVEVLVSHQNKRGSFMVPGLIEPGWFGWECGWIKNLSLDENGAMVLNKIYEAGLKAVLNKNALAINYRQLPDFIWSGLKDFFHLELSEKDLDKMKEVPKYYSKNPGIKFTDMPEFVSKPVSKHTVELIEKYVAPVYIKLEAIRKPL